MDLQIGWWVGTGLAAQPVVRRIIVPGMKGFLFCSAGTLRFEIVG